VLPSLYILPSLCAFFLLYTSFLLYTFSIYFLSMLPSKRGGGERRERVKINRLTFCVFKGRQR
jgi:hypothetical protein